ncbi:BA14K family protein [Roseibium sp. AS2]|uniref:BA14K family protein n=1 Tax=Roseibium sp. AS2 TaxID=3135781 RepID=UPI00317FA483
MKFKALVLSGIMSSAFLLGGPLPANAVPLAPLNPAVSQHTDAAPLVRADHRPGHRSNGHQGNRGPNYHNGHRGYRKPRKGYRQHNGWWFPPAAFSLRFAPTHRNTGPRYVPGHGPDPRHGRRQARGLTPAHYQWCNQRYRSYRSADNTFQPYNGPRRACVSPYTR